MASARPSDPVTLDEARRQMYRSQIIAAAEGEFARAGFRDCRMGDVAATAGISLATLYKHFAGKDALWDAVNATRMAEFMAAVDAAVAEVESALDGLLAAARAEVEFLTTHDAFLAMQLKDGLNWATSTAGPSQRRGGQRQAWEQGMGLVTRAAERAIRRGEVGVSSPDLVAALVVSALQIWLTRWVDSGRRQSPTEVADEVVTHLRRCLAP